MIEGINDEAILNQVMEEVAFYVGKNDIADELTSSQLQELDEAIDEANNNETIPWNEFKMELATWKK